MYRLRQNAVHPNKKIFLVCEITKLSLHKLLILTTTPHALVNSHSLARLPLHATTSLLDPAPSLRYVHPSTIFILPSLTQIKFRTPFLNIIFKKFVPTTNLKQA
jgi:hypothetical protein